MPEFASMLSVVVPALNEEASIGRIIERLRQTKARLVQSGQVSDVELLVVDDGSTDRTPDAVRAFLDVRLIQHAVNLGYGAALKTGFREARGEYIAFLDADESYRPESLPQLLEPITDGRADLVIGSRMLHERGGMPWTRYVGNWLFARLLGWLVGQRISDSASGLRVFRRSMLPRLFPLPDGLDMTPAMSARALHEGLRTIEIPIPYDARTGRSKLRIVRDGLRFFSSILSVSRLYNPLKVFGLLGCSFLLLALLLGVAPLVHYVQAHRVEETAIYRLFTVMVLIVTGVNVVTFGAFSNQVLSILYPHRPLQRSAWARLLLRRGVVRSSGWVGAAFMGVAVLLNARTIQGYLATGAIHVHWSYILTGATLFLTGVQLVMSRFLLSILEQLQRRHESI